MTKDMGISQVKASVLAYCSEFRPRADVIAHIMRLSSKMDRDMASKVILVMTRDAWLDLDPKGNELKITSKGSKALTNYDAEEFE